MKQDTLTEFYQAHTAAPERVGPYQCRIVHPETRQAASDAFHWRWFDGQDWSLPIVPDDFGDLEAPTATHFLRDDGIGEVLETIEWRGHTEDQDPL